uniref:Glutathione peroxidase n=1 Tax=Globisporangium ultimum (strain ATCC 200006 / CBS 805.95 / DAOM BR144) TaxID=431595 RepID=K3WJ85_GLOUD
MSADMLQGRVFARYREFLKLSEEQRQRVHALADALIASNTLIPQKSSGSTTSRAFALDVSKKQLLKAIRDSTATEEEDAELLVDQLVQSGFLALKHEDDLSTKKASEFDANATFTLARVTTSRPDEKSVWSVREGAIQAGTLKRASKFSKLFGGKELYFVVNSTDKVLYWFDSDAAMHTKGQMNLDGAAVQFDSTAFPFGIKVSKEKACVYLGTPSKEKQDEWLNSVINGGAVYREAFNLDAEAVTSIYDLKDYDMSGQEVPIDKYKGKVLLVVNVSSNCGLTPSNYPALVELDNKYRDQGLVVLAFPCNQFALQEPGTHEEIMEFVKKYNCKFPFFEKNDVNGAKARPVFTYLKAKLPTKFGSFVKWNFTKFLIDRKGQPYKRFSPYDLPTSFEDDIQLLLAQKADD